MPDPAEDDELRPREGDSETVKRIYAGVRNCVRINERSRRALREKVDLIYAEGIKHRKGKDGWSDDAERLFTRHSIPPSSDRKDKHPGAYWRPLVRLFVAPTPLYFDENSHPSLIAEIGNACWAKEELDHISPGVIKAPSEGIMHPALGEGSVARFSFVPFAWREQVPYQYDSSAKPANVPPAHLYPPPAGRAPIGTEEEGNRDGQIAGRRAGTVAAESGKPISLPPPPERNQDGRPFSDAYRRGWNHGARSTAARALETRLGEIEGEIDARKRALDDVQQEKQPLSQDEIIPETLGDRRDKPHAYITAYRRVAVPLYLQLIADLKAKVEAEAKRKAEKAEREIEARRKAEEEARQTAAEAEARAAREAEARRKAEAEGRQKAAKAEAEAEEAQRKADDAERKRKQEAEARKRAEAEAKRLREQDTKRRADEAAKAARERDDKRRKQVAAEVIKCLVAAGIPKSYSNMVFAAMQKGIPHVKIVY